MSTSCELMKKQGPIGETLTEMKTEKTLKMLKMLNTLNAQAKKAQKLQKMDKKNRPGMPKPKPKEIDAAQEAELRQAFELFDKDGSGTRPRPRDACPGGGVSLPDARQGWVR